MTGSRARSLLLAGTLVAIAFAYWQWRVLAPIRVPQEVSVLSQDLFTIYVPFHTLAYQSDGLLPLWNPFQLAGAPLVGSYNGGALFPLNLLSTVLPVPTALGVICAASLALAGIFTFACARAVQLSYAASLLAACLFLLNQMVVFTHLQPSFLAGTALVPLVFLLAGRLLVAPSVARAAGLGVAVALQFLSGHAQIVLYTAYGVLVAALPYLLARSPIERAPLLRLAATCALAVLIAVLLSAVQLLPTLEMVREASRGALTLEQTLAVGRRPVSFARALVSSGPIAILSALLGLLALADRRRRVLLASCVSLLAFAGLFGFATPAYDYLFYYLPGVDRFRMPFRMLIVGGLGAVLLAGMGLDAAGGVARRWVPSSRATVVVPWLVVALALFERFWTTGNTVMVPERSGAPYFAPPPFVEFLRERSGPDRIFLVKDHRHRFLLMEKLGSLHQLRVVQDFEPLTPRRYQEFLGALAPWNIDAPLFWGRFGAPPTAPGWLLLDRLAARYVAVDKRTGWNGNAVPKRFRQVYDDGEVRVYENLLALPRARLVSHAVVQPNDQRALQLLRSGRLDPHRSVIVDRAIEWPGDGPSPAPEESIEWLEDGFAAVQLDVSTPGRAILVLADLHWPGWRVLVDGEERPLLRVDHLLRGVALAPGKHRVTFRYEPVGFRVGALLSGSTAMILCAAAVIARRRRIATGRRPVAPDRPSSA